MASDNIETAFKRACQYVECCSLGENSLLELYGLYKQATVGDCNVQQPGMFDFRAKSKWKAWSRMKGLSQDDAKREYVKCLSKLDPDWTSAVPNEQKRSWVVTSSLCHEDEVPESMKDIYDWVKENQLDKIKQFDKKLLADIRDEDGLTLLHWAADRGHLNVVKYLVTDAKVELNCRDSESQTPLHYAAACGYPTICEYLVKCGADKNAKDNSCQTPADVAESLIIKELLTS